MVERDVVVVIFNYRLGLLGRVFSIEFCFVYIYIIEMFEGSVIILDK